MLIKKYVVNSMNEALTRIRYELGKDAVIISQRKVKKQGIKGIFSKRQIEVTAAVENSYIERNTKNSKAKLQKTNNISKDSFIENNSTNSESFQKSIDTLKMVMNKHIDNSKNIVRKNPIIDKNNDDSNVKVTTDSSAKLEDEVKEMKKMLAKVYQNTNKINEDPLLDFLNKSDIDNRYYDNIKERLSGDETEDNIKKIISSDISISNKDLSKNVVLVGPTGVGKTTTIAKLAGRLSLIDKKKVGLITVDTYRIGAVEQLKTYAEIMNIPFEVVITIKEMEKAIQKMKDCDVVLIDTTGRSSKNKMQISELRAFVDKAGAENISIVISATTKNRDIQTILDGYRELNYDNVIITKLDETSTYGSIYNIAKIADKPIRFVTTGQNVPDDILDVSKDKIVKLIFGEESLC